jgi:ferredoxin
MKIIADAAKCCGHARCSAVAESLFLLDDNGYIAIREVAVAPGMESLARRGVRACPERALSIKEDEDRTASGVSPDA